MIKISDLAAEVDRVAGENPDETYFKRAKELIGRDDVACRYQINGDPACIIGVALSNLGVSGQTLAEMDNAMNSTIISIASSSVDLFEVDDKKALNYLDSAQANQDLGYEWGKTRR